METPFGEWIADEGQEGFVVSKVSVVWDIAQATGVDAAIPEDLAQKGLDVMYAFGDAVRGPGIFGDEVEVAQDAAPQDKLIAYSGRKPKG